MAQLMSVRLSRTDAQPWGFRLQGGKDFGTPLVIQKVNGGSIADNAGLIAGDAVLKVNGVEVFNLRHKDAQDVVVRAGNSFEVTVQRGGSTWKPSVTPTGQLPMPSAHVGNVGPVTRTSLAAKPQEVHHIGSGYNTAARPFSAVNGDGVKSIVNKQYNTPVGIYSEESIAETLSAQAEVLAGGVLGVNFKKNEKIYNSANSEVYKMLQEAENEPPEPEELSSHISPAPVPHHYGPPVHQQQPQPVGVTKHVTAPINQPLKAPNTGGLPTGQNICADCERLIVGVFVRIKDKNLHVDCFKCATCGSSLKNQGYFNINNKLYCDIHAKLAALNNPPPGTEGYLPVPIKPNTKLSASTISAALNAHHTGNVNGSTQLITSPTLSNNQHNILSPSHSRTSSSASTYTISSNSAKTSPSQSNLVSPAHSRQSSGTFGSPISKCQNDFDVQHNNSYNNSLKIGQDVNYENCDGNCNGNGKYVTKLYLDTDFPNKDLNENNNQKRTVVDGAGQKNNGLSESIYGSIMPQAKKQPGEEFKYKTLDGRVIRSVQAPGKGKNVNYKINTNIGGPKPFNYSSGPMSPPMAGPKSPSSYPPPNTAPTWAQPRPIPVQHIYTTPKPAGGTNYATLPRVTAQTAQGRYNTFRPGTFNKESQGLDQCEHDEITHELHPQQQQSNFIWPPRGLDEDRGTPTAAPIYIAPPETQHVIVKPLLEKQSMSAPELSNMSSAARDAAEVESSSESCTSTSTTTTSSDEYCQMRMYQMQASVPSYMTYDQSSFSDMETQDLELAAMASVQHKQSICSTEVATIISGRRSAQECADYLTGSLSISCLVDTVRALTPRPPSPPPKPPKHVEFREQPQLLVLERDDSPKDQNDTESKFKENHVDNYCETKSEQRQEMKTNTSSKSKTTALEINIPEVKPLPPTNIPNPVPKEWESAMLKALKTAPARPFSPMGPQVAVEEECKKMDAIKNMPTSVINVDINSDVLKEAPPAGSFMTSLLATAPSAPMEFVPKNTMDPISLPEETEAYFPPPIKVKPIQKEENLSGKSPMLKALVTAPDRPYSPFGQEVMYQLDDLPTPKGIMTMHDALTVASDRPYTPMTFDTNGLAVPLSQVQTESFSRESTEVKSSSIEQQMSQQLSAFANVQGVRSICSFQPKSDAIPTIKGFKSTFTNDSLIDSSSIAKQTLSKSSQQQSFLCSSSVQSCQAYQQQQQFSSHTSSVSSNVQQSSQQSKSSITTLNMDSAQGQSSTHEPNTSLPPLNPFPRPARFSGLHKPDTIPLYQKNIQQLPSQHPIKPPVSPQLKENVPIAFLDIPKEISAEVPKPVAMTGSITSNNKLKSNQKTDKQNMSTEIKSVQSAGPITMTFQSLDMEELSGHDDIHLRPVTPTTHLRPHTPSLINKPAPTIPYYQQNLVMPEFDPQHAHIFDPKSRSPSPSPITRAKSPAQGPPPNPLRIHAPRLKETEEHNQKLMLQQLQQLQQSQNMSTQYQGQNRNNYQVTGESAFLQKPEIIEQKRIGDTNIQMKSNEAQFNQQKRAEMESATITQIGNAQVQRRTKVVEEFERTQSAKTVEILKTSGDEISQNIVKADNEMPPKGIVANQARRFSQDVSCVANKVQNLNAKIESQSVLKTEASKLSSTNQQKHVSFPAHIKQETVSQFPKSPNPDSFMSGPPPKTAAVAPPPGFQSKDSNTMYQATAAGQQTTQKQASSMSFQTSSAYSLSSAQSKQSSISSFSSVAATTAPSATKQASNQLPFSLTSAVPVPAFKPPAPFAANTCEFKPNQTTPAYMPSPSTGPGFKPPANNNTTPSAVVSDPFPASAGPSKGGSSGITSIPKRGRGILNKPVGIGGRIPQCGCCRSQIRRSYIEKDNNQDKNLKEQTTMIANDLEDGKHPVCCTCNAKITRGPFITALGRIWCPDHFVCVNGDCRRPLADIGFVEEKGDLYCEYCFEKYIAPTCNKCVAKIKGDCLNAIGKHFHPECFTCAYCGKLFGNSPFFLEEGNPYCEADWNELFTTKCFACGFPVEAGDRWVEALSHNYHSQCFNCTMCKKNLEGQSFFAKGGRPFCKNHAR